MYDYQIRFEPVAGTGHGQSYSINDKPNVVDAIKLAKIKHSMDFGFMNVRQVVDTVKVWDDETRQWIEIYPAAEEN